MRTCVCARADVAKTHGRFVFFAHCVLFSTWRFCACSRYVRFSIFVLIKVRVFRSLSRFRFGGFINIT